MRCCKHRSVLQVLKADIEGAELDLLASWQDRRMVLPQQLGEAAS
jgi:hypothetical protein